MASPARLKEYTRNRAKLVVDEKMYRGDYEFGESLSPVAQAASMIVSRIQHFNRQVLFDPRDEPTNFNLHLESCFPHIKESAARTALFEIIKKLPKGAILHAHHAACVSVDFIIDKMIETPGMYMSASRPLDSRHAKYEKRITIKFVYSSSQPRLTRSAARTLWNSDYEPGSLVPVSLAASTFSNVDAFLPRPKVVRSGKVVFANWLKSRLIDRRAQHGNVSGGINEAWNTFQTGMKLVNTMIHNEPIFRPFLRRLFEGLHEDNIKWMEIRMVFKVGFQLEGSDTVSGELEMARVTTEEIEKFSNLMKKKEKGWWGLRVIWTSLRVWKDEDLKADMENCMLVKERYPNLISGYDVVGREELGRTLDDLAPRMLWFKEQCKLRNLNIPFFLHAGECLGTGDVNDHNLYDAFLLGARRIGHGYSLPKHPLLEELYKEHQIMVESCPISNESLRLTHSTSAHTLPMLLAKGVGASLNCDDPYLLGQEMTGVSMEFFMAIWSWESLGLGGLGHLAQNSVKWSQFEDQSDEDWKLGIQEGDSLNNGLKGERMREWKDDWEEFCAWIVERYEEPWGNEEAYKAVLKEREDLEKEYRKEEEKEEKEFWDRWDKKRKRDDEWMLEQEKKFKKRARLMKKAKELLMEEKLQKDMAKDSDKTPDKPNKAPKVVLKKSLKS